MTATKPATVSGTSFDELLPDAPIGQRHKYKEDTFIKWSSPKPCHHCNEPTRWASVIFELRICSPRCADALMEEYFYAVESVGGVRVGFPGQDEE